MKCPILWNEEEQEAVTLWARSLMWKSVVWDQLRSARLSWYFLSCLSADQEIWL